MTIICALHDSEHGCTWIGSDTSCNLDSSQFPSHRKWSVNGSWGVGVAGDYRAQLLIDENIDVLRGESPYRICLRIRDILQKDGFEPTRDNKGHGFPSFGQNIILASPDNIWSVDGALTPALMKVSFFADGSGWELAHGAVFAVLAHAKLQPRAIIETAIKAAINGDTKCGGDVWLHKLEGR